MSPGQKPETDFERRLRSQLKAIVAERGEAATRLEAEEASTASPAWRRRGPRLAMGAAVALAAVGSALVVSAGSDSTSQAFAVEPHEGGGVSIEIYNLDDAGGVEAALEDAGVPSQVTYLAPGMTCREPHYQPSTVEMPPLPDGSVQPFSGLNLAGPVDSMTIGVGTAEQQHELFEGSEQGDSTGADVPGFVVDPTAFRPDQTLIIAAAPISPDSPNAVVGADDPAGGAEMAVRVAAGEVGPCDPVPVSGDSWQIRPPAGA